MRRVFPDHHELSWVFEMQRPEQHGIYLTSDWDSRAGPEIGARVNICRISMNPICYLIASNYQKPSHVSTIHLLSRPFIDGEPHGWGSYCRPMEDRPVGVASSNLRAPKPVRQD